MAKQVKRLRIDAETIRQLDELELKAVAGGPMSIYGEKQMWCSNGCFG